MPSIFNCLETVLARQNLIDLSFDVPFKVYEKIFEVIYIPQKTRHEKVYFKELMRRTLKSACNDFQPTFNIFIDFI